MLLFYYFFFFKQKTAYEMRISDWSSDVCSSDLSLSLVPMLLSAQQGQAFEAPARLSVRKLFRISPLGLSVSFLNGISQGAFYVGLGLFGVAIGLPAGEVGLLVAAGTLGGVLGQFPLGALSDRVDRRLVIAGAAAAGLATSLFVAMAAGRKSTRLNSRH